MNAPALITIPHTGSIFTMNLLNQHWKVTEAEIWRSTKTYAFKHVDVDWRVNLTMLSRQDRKLITLYRDPLRTLATWCNRYPKFPYEKFLYYWEIWMREIAPKADFIFEPTNPDKRDESLRGLEEVLGVRFETDWEPANKSTDRLGLHGALDLVEDEPDDIRAHVFWDSGLFPRTPVFVREVLRFGRN